MRTGLTPFCTFASDGLETDGVSGDAVDDWGTAEKVWTSGLGRGATGVAGMGATVEVVTVAAGFGSNLGGGGLAAGTLGVAAAVFVAVTGATGSVGSGAAGLAGVSGACGAGTRRVRCDDDAAGAS